jgi:hypothetical protein
MLPRTALIHYSAICFLRFFLQKKKFIYFCIYDNSLQYIINIHFFPWPVSQYSTVQYWAVILQEILSWNPCLSTTQWHPKRWKGILRSYLPVIWKSNRKSLADKKHLPAVVHLQFLSSSAALLQRKWPGAQSVAGAQQCPWLPWEFGQPMIFTSCRSSVPSIKHDFIDSTNGSERHFKFQALLPATHL